MARPSYVSWMPHRDVRVRSTIFSAFALFAAACSDAGSHAPYMLAACEGMTCGGGNLGRSVPVMGGSVGTTTDGGVGIGAGMNGSSGGAAVATNCSSEFGVTLCLSTAACPGIVLDATQFPSCGFRAGTSSISVVCVCNGTSLCPIGAVATCDALPTLLQQETITDVCNQATVTGVCSDLGAGLSSGTVNATTCDRNCAATCDNTPVCLAACGC
jgi:hypothetical protein